MDSDLFYFFCSGRGKGESEAQWGGGGGSRFFIENPRRGVSRRERGRAAGRVSAANWEFGEGGGLNIFLRGRNVHQETPLEKKVKAKHAWLGIPSPDLPCLAVFEISLPFLSFSRFPCLFGSFPLSFARISWVRCFLWDFLAPAQQGKADQGSAPKSFFWWLAAKNLL